MISRESAIEAWHFLNADGRLANTPRRTEPVRVGEVLHIKPPLELCQRGLHGSRRILDALQYARGPILCRTIHWGDVQEDSDKLCSEYRCAISIVDASRVLHEFACVVATQAMDLVESRGGTIDPRSRAAVVAKRRWLAGEIDDKELASAKAAARTAWGARAAWGASEAAKASANASAWGAAWAEQNKLLTNMIKNRIITKVKHL